LATIIPLSEKKSPSGGHLLSCTVGNICGILIYIVVLKRLDLSLQLIFFLISLGYLMWQEEEIKYKRLIYGAVLAFIVILLGVSLDRKISMFSLQYLADYNGDFDSGIP
jgi:inner membrane protein involved in colicin E2 resistance